VAAAAEDRLSFRQRQHRLGGPRLAEQWRFIISGQDDELREFVTSASR
jgi:hypothetical protein